MPTTEARLIALEKSAPRIAQKRRNGMGFDEFVGLMCGALAPLSVGKSFSLEAQSWLDAMTAAEIDQLSAALKQLLKDSMRDND